jgi:integrase
MALAMIRPTKHPKSGVYRLRLAVPAGLRASAVALFGVRAEFIENLGTKVPADAKRLAPAADSRLRAKLAAADAHARGLLSPVTEKQVAALGGVHYRRELAAIEDNPGDPADWEIAHTLLGDQIADTDEPQTAPAADWDVKLSLGNRRDATALLHEHGLPADPRTVDRVALAVFRANVKVAEAGARLAAGNFAPDSATLTSFPPIEAARQSPKVPEGPLGCAMGALLAGWGADRGFKMDAKPMVRALYDRHRTLTRLGLFLHHQDAGRVAKADAVRWKEDMHTRGLLVPTIRNDLSEMSALWTWGIRNGKLADGPNPFAGVSPPKAKKRGTEVRAYTDAEAASLLGAARQARGFLRWLPWVLCLTGCRISEVCQSTKEDVATVDGVLCLRVHDEGEGRSLKNADSRRTIPVHPALIAEGFPAYVASLPARSPLFPDIRPDAVFEQRGNAAGKILARWTRATGVTDTTIRPAHSYRHWFVEAARRALIHPEVRSALTGHSAKMDESAAYGAGMGTLVSVLAAAGS